MSLNLPSRHLARSAPSLLSHPRPVLPSRHTSLPSPHSPHQSSQHRQIFNFFRKKRPPPIDPYTTDLLKQSPKTRPQRTAPEPGSLASDSIFGPETDPSTSPPPSTTASPATPGSKPDAATSPPHARAPAPAPSKGKSAAPRDPALMAPALNPNPSARARWQRKMVIRQIQHRGRLTKAQVLARTERVHLHKSPFFETSLKKLYPLARQIAGKSVEEAIVQMRFSKKRVAQDVKRELAYARDSAVVRAGMGLGGVKRVGNGEGEGRGMLEGGEEVVKYENKDGKVKEVKPTAMYIDQAWVGRGKFDFAQIARARGNRNIAKRPTTSISFVLKEEKTRIRLSKEREQKRLDKKPWVHHPDRPITAQSQYILW